MKLCLCGHPRSDHDTGNGKEPCSRRLHPACGCDGFRLDYRSRLGPDETDAAAEGREPLRAAAERAYAEGRLKPLPRMPSVRPESDYEMHFHEGA